MLVNCAGPDVAGLQTPPAHRDALADQAKALKLDAILAGLDILTTTKARMRTSNHGLVLVQMAVVRLARLEDLLSVGQLVQALSQPGAIAPRPGGGARPADLPEAKKKTASLNGNGHAAPANGTSPPAGPTALTPESLPQIWAEVLAQVGGTLAVSLGKAGLPAILGPKSLVAVFAAEYNFHYERCSDQAVVTKTEAALHRVTGQTWSLKVELASSSEARPAAAAPAARPLQAREAVLKDPLVQRAVEVLGASLLRQDPGFGQTTASPPTPPAGGRDNEES
jgi:DNA polymerase-3 subunit gamma/tau